MPRTEEANQRIRDERKEQILDAAAKVFARKGLAGTRIADIAAEGNISQGLIFRYFTSKEEVFAAVLHRGSQSAIRLAQAALQQPGSPMGKLRWLLQVSLEGLWRKPEYAQVTHHAFSSEAMTPEIREMALEQSKPILQLYQRLIIEGQEAGEVVQGDPATLTLVFSACIGGLSAGISYLPHALGINEPPDPDLILRILKP